MKTLVKISLLLLVVAIIFSACGPKQQPNLTPDSTDNTKSKVPEWFLDKPKNDDNYFYAVATATSRDLQQAINKSKQEARAELSNTLEIYIKAKSDKFDRETGLNQNSTLKQEWTNVSRNVTANVLKGTEEDKKDVVEEERVWRAYILMTLPVGAAAQELFHQLNENDALKVHLEASEAFMELEEEVEKYEANK